jgi:hypothetical protein
MSKSGIRLLSLVALVGSILVGALYLFGTRAVEHARRPPARMKAPPRVAPDVPVFTDQEPQTETPPSVAAAPRLPLLPAIAADRPMNVWNQPAEIPAAAGSPAAVERQGRSEARPMPDSRNLVMRSQLQAVLARHPNVELAFVTCRDADCLARAEAHDLATLKAFILEATAAPARLKAEVHEQSTAFNGTVYRVDLEGAPTAPAPGG